MIARKPNAKKMAVSFDKRHKPKKMPARISFFLINANRVKAQKKVASPSRFIQVSKNNVLGSIV